MSAKDTEKLRNGLKLFRWDMIAVSDPEDEPGISVDFDPNKFIADHSAYPRHGGELSEGASIESTQPRERAIREERARRGKMRDKWARRAVATGRLLAPFGIMTALPYVDNWRRNAQISFFAVSHSGCEAMLKMFGCAAHFDPCDEVGETAITYFEELILDEGYRFCGVDIGEDESLVQFLTRKVIDHENLASVAKRWERAGGDAELFALMAPPSERPTDDDTITWAVKGVIPMREVTLLVGAQETGKSTIAAELALAIGGANDGTWLGRKVEAVALGGVVAVIAGEDSKGIVLERRRILDPNETADGIVELPRDVRKLKDILAQLSRIPKLSLVVIDPARKYLEGDEDSSDPVSQFFNEIDKLVNVTGAAVVVIHHLRKNSRPNSLADVRADIRGSGVWLDRPRFGLGMYRRGDLTMIGRIKGNIPPGHDPIVEEALLRDSTTLRHLPAATFPAASVSAISAAPIESERGAILNLALTAATSLIAGKHKLSRTGKRSLFGYRLPELSSLSRATLEWATDQLVIGGDLISNEDGLSLPAK